MQDVNNSKQMEFLNDIRKVGMNLIYGTVTGDEAFEVFEKYEQYIFNSERYMNTLMSIKNLIDARDCTPDKLLMEMGKHTLEIEYEDEIYVEENLFDAYY